MKTELHIHTRYSNDSILAFWILLVMCKINKIDCIAVCDHNVISFQSQKKKFERRGIKVIIGEEIFTSDGEIIGLFLSETIPRDLSAEKTVEEIRRQNGLVYIPHPYDEKRKRTVLKENVLSEISSNIDLIEVHNGRNISSAYSDKQKKMADKYCSNKNIAQICGSDAHTFFEIGRNYVISNKYSTDDPAEFKKAMLNKSMFVRKCHPMSHAVTKAVKIIVMIKNGDIDGITEIIKRRCKKRND